MQDINSSFLLIFHYEMKTREMNGGPTTHSLLFGQMVCEFFKRGNFFLKYLTLKMEGFLPNKRWTKSQ